MRVEDLIVISARRVVSACVVKINGAVAKRSIARSTR